MKVGQLVKELRLKKGVTQEDLAAQTGISVRTIQRIESCEVNPRSHTLQTIATALEVEFESFAVSEPISDDADGAKPSTVESSKWLPLLHLSGLLILIVPPIILWILKRNEVEGIKKHAFDVINFQLSMSLYALLILIMGIKPIVILLFLYSQVVIVINCVRVTSSQSYKYPLSIRFLKNEPAA